MNPKLFNVNDIVVWQGAITTYGTIRELVEQDDLPIVRLADNEEVIRYMARPSK